MLITTLSVIGVWFGVHWAYVAIMHARHVHEKTRLTLYWWVMLAPLLVLGYALDLVMNLTFGTIMFFELPRELLFSERVQRHVNESHDWRFEVAVRLAEQLNVFDEHIILDDPRVGI